MLVWVCCMMGCVGREKYSAREVSAIWIVGVAQVSKVICIVLYHTMRDE